MVTEELKLKGGPKALTRLLQRSRVLVFDFDGTLVDSTEIKGKAFENCFRSFPNRLEEILAYCRGNNHTVRTEKFRWVYEKILGLPYTPEIERQLGRTFEACTTRQIVQAPEIPGAEGFLRARQGRQTLVLLYSTPHEILLEILEGKGWRPLFSMVRGAPVVKAEFLLGFMRRESLAPGEMVFFGDTPEDAEAARKAGCPFVAVRSAPAAGGEGASIHDFREIADE